MDANHEAIATIPSAVQKDPYLEPFKTILQSLQNRIPRHLDPRNVTVYDALDRMAMTLIREYTLMPLFHMPELQTAWQTYLRNAGNETDMTVDSPLLAAVFAAEKQALEYERRLEAPDVINQDFRLLHPLLVLSFAHARAAELYLLAFAAGWVTEQGGQAILTLPDGQVIALVVSKQPDPTSGLPALIAGLLTVAIVWSRDEAKSVLASLEANINNPDQALQDAWRAYLNRYHPQPVQALPAAPLTECPHCGAAIEADDKFCDECGGKIPTSAAPSPAPGEPQKPPFEGQEQVLQDLAAVAGLAAYRRLTQPEDWGKLVMKRSRRVDQ
jgi:hypothetical protein